MQWRNPGQTRVGCAVAALIVVCCVPFSASADRAAAARSLVEVGGLNPAQARHVVKKVSAKMAKSAGAFTRDDDVIRRTVSRALFNADVPGDRTDRAKVRLRLFSGLTEWSLPILFGPGADTLAACRRTFTLSRGQCAALATVGKRFGGGARPAQGGARSSGAAAAAVQEAPAASSQGHAAQAVAPPPMGRFPRYDSGYRGSQQQAASSAAPATQRPAQPTQARAPAAQPRVQARATPTPARVPPAKQAAIQQNTREAYLARRQAYLERQKARAEAQKKERQEKLAASQVERGPAADSAEVQTTLVPGQEGAGAGKAAAPRKPAKAEQDDNELADFVDGLLSE